MHGHSALLQTDGETVKIVEVEWIDSCGQSGWHPVKTHEENRPAKCKTSGYLVGRSKAHITVCLSEDTDNKNLNDSMVIPMSSVKKIRVLKA